MKPCSITTMSRLKPGTSKLTSAPPWYSAPKSRLASTMPSRMVAPHQRHRDAGEAGAADELEQQLAAAHRRSRSCPPARPARRRWPSPAAPGASGRCRHRPRRRGWRRPRACGSRRADATAAGTRPRPRPAPAAGSGSAARPATAMPSQPSAWCMPGSCAAAREGRAFHRHQPGRLEVVDQQPDQQRAGQEVEHDGGDDHMAAAVGLQPGRHRRPGHAEERAAARPSAAAAARPAAWAASHSATSPVPSPPSMAWPSPPMLNSPPWKATATASPVKMKVVA